jgi:TrmH family RNA methyltransferase
MIPLYKLEKLPRNQKLRKIAKVFTMAENRLCFAIEKKGGIFTAAEYAFFAQAAELLAADGLFPPEARKVFIEAAGIFNAAIQDIQSLLSASDAAGLRRALNCVKHILLSETGREQADWDFTVSDGRLDPAQRQIFEGVWVYLEDIRSPFNVGAMFRTAESFGVQKIILSPFCADPRHRRAERTAMGCIDIVPWERRELFASDILPCPVFALETGGVPLTEFPFPRRGLLIAGSEELGVSPRALAAADVSLGRVSIPCYGAKASLNVSVAFGIAMQAWAARNNAK